MKKYNTLLLILFLFAGTVEIQAQTISYSFANAQITNDGSDNFYEADILLSTDTDFKLGIGQFFIDYNELAFGSNIFASGNLVFLHPDGIGGTYILDERFAGVLNVYVPTVGDNSSSKLGIAWTQGVGSAAISTTTASNSPHLLLHLKIKFTDVNEDPMIAFDSNFEDLTFHADTNPGSGDGAQITDDSYDSSGASLNNTWLGNTTDWDTASNWSSNNVPTASSNVIVPNLANAPNATASIVANKLTLEENASLTVTSNATLNDKMILNSGSSLIVGGTTTGNMIYNRTLPTNNWYLVSSPFDGETIEDLISNHTFDTGTGGNIGLAPYNNGASGWNYQNNSSTGTIASGSGLSAKLASAGDISFAGSMHNTENIFFSTASTDGFHLIGNPYPSYLAANNPTNSINFLGNVDNAAFVLTESTIWVWNSSLDVYETVNHATGPTFIAPGQGFFVSALSFSNILFTKGMQSHQSTDTFLRTGQTSTRPEIELTISDGPQTKKADIFYINGTTTGWDNGYDSTMFNGGGNDTFSIYTHLVSDSQGQNLTIQSLPDSNYENMVIPVGINATNGTEITISANSINFPAEIDVYLEDKNNNSFTLLDNSSDFTTTLTNDLNGIGRFYLHTNTSTVLSTDEVTLENISIYTSERNNLRLTGIQNGNATVKIYNILGKQILQTSFQGSGTNDISLPNLNAGIYIIQLQTETGRLNKKISIQ